MVGFPEIAPQALHLQQKENLADLKRVIGLDIVRSIAILSVVCCHILLSVEPNNNICFKIANALGFLGVEMFFVLSGFLIGGILFRQVQQNPQFGSKQIGSFWIRRWMRTVPNYLLFIAINLFFAAKHGNHPVDTYRYLFFWQNLVPKHPIGWFFQESWSLSVEEWLYFTFPIALFAVNRARRSQNIQISTLVCVIVFLVIPTIARLLGSDGLRWDAQVRKIVAFRLDAIAWGLLTAHISVFQKEKWAKLATKRVSEIGLCLLLISVVAFCAQFSQADDRYGGITGLFMNVLLFVLLNVGFALIVPFMSTVSALPRVVHEIVYRTSIYSYSMYLVHSLLIGFVFHGRLASMLNHGVLRCVLFAVFFGLLYAVSGGIYHLFELPMTQLRDKVKPRHNPRV